MAESRNKLRGSKSKAPVIYTISVISIMGLFFILYATYAYLSYIYANKIENPSMNDIIASLNILFTAESFVLPITFDVIKEVIWWLYVSIVAVVFLVITSKNPNDFKGIGDSPEKYLFMVCFRKLILHIYSISNERNCPLRTLTYATITHRTLVSCDGFVVFNLNVFHWTDLAA